MAPIKSKPRTEKPKTKHNGIAKRKPESKSKQKSSVPKKNTLKKRKTYTDEELGIPKLNMITPAGVQKPRGKKKGKIFVDDQESMMTILAMVNADKEGQIESKMMRARQMEAIREARQKEAEARQEHKRSKFEETKDSLRKRKTHKQSSEKISPEPSSVKSPKRGAKRVSFG